MNVILPFIFSSSFCCSFYLYISGLSKWSNDAGNDLLERSLQEILQIKTNPPTLKDVARKMHIPLRTLRVIDPENCKRIADRRFVFESKKARDMEREKIHQVDIKTLASLRSGNKLTLKDITQFLPNPAYVINPKVRHSIKKALSDFFSY